MSQEMGNYFVVPRTITTVEGLTLQKGTHLWIPGELSTDTHPKNIYTLDHPWNDLDPGENMETLVPDTAGWIEIVNLIATQQLIRTSQFGIRL